jgi:hypothetical protein
VLSRSTAVSSDGDVDCAGCGGAPQSFLFLVYLLFGRLYIIILITHN